MMICGIEVEANDVSDSFFQRINEKLSKCDNLFENPFVNSGAYFIDNTVRIVKLDSIYPNVSLFLIVPMVGLLYFKLYTISLIVACIMILLQFLFSKYFMYITAVIGLRKAGYKGKIRLIGNQKLLSILLQRWK
jgi:hypothetical protein